MVVKQKIAKHPSDALRSKSNTEKLEHEILQSESNFKLIKDLFAFSQDLENESSFSAIRSLNRIFSFYRKKLSIDLVVLQEKKKKRLKTGIQDDKEDSVHLSKSTFAKIVNENFEIFLEILFRTLEKSDSALQGFALQMIMSNLQTEADIERSKEEARYKDLSSKKNIGETFPLRFLQKVLKKIFLNLPNLDLSVINIFTEKYICENVDLRYWMYVGVTHVLELIKQKIINDEKESNRLLESKKRKRVDENNSNNTNEEDESNTSCITIPVNVALMRVCESIIQIPVPEKTANSKQIKTDTLEGKYSSSSFVTKNQSTTSSPSSIPTNFFITSYKSQKATDIEKIRHAFQNMWQHLLKLPLPNTPSLPTLKKCLHYVPTHVLPYLSNPLLVSDFYISAFDRRGKGAAGAALGVLALSGLFYLMSRYQLGEGGGDELISQKGGDSSNSISSFYLRLYILLEPTVFYLPLRTRFLKLVSLSLKSSLLPSKLLCSFLKKLVRCSTLLPPSGALWCIGCVHQLIQKHKDACVKLIHIEPKAAELIEYVNGDMYDPSNVFMKTGKEEEEEGNVIEEVEELSEKEKIRLNEAKEVCKYSLWELKLLKKHYHPSVNQLVKLFEDPQLFKNNARKTLADDFLDCDISSLTRLEIKNRLGELELATNLEKERIVPDDVSMLYNNSVYIE